MEVQMQMQALEVVEEVPEGERPEERDIPADENGPIPGVYGWKKRCLYFSLLLMLVILLVNFGLTLWIILVLDFNQHGMGNLRITDSGLRLQGRAEFTDTLYARTIASDQDNSLVIESQKSVNVSSGDSEVSVSPDQVTINTQTFSVYTHDSTSSSPADQPPVLSVTNHSISVNADTLQVRGALGLTVAAGVETNSLSPPPGRDLSLDARGGRLEVVGGGGGVKLEGGFTGGSEGVEISSNADLSLESRTGSIVLSSPSIQLVGLPISGTPSSDDGVLEVCACSSGKLYLVPALSSDGCHTDSSVCST